MPARAYTRVAVAQIACQPAISLPGRAPFEDPLFDMARGDSLLPEGEPPPELEKRFDELRERIAHVHREQLMLKVEAILRQCQQWGVRLIVFPEYSLPWQVLEQVARAGGDLVIVAGTHSVTRPAVRSGIYEQLGGKRPALGEAVCPVLHRGRLLGLQPKLSFTEMEQELRRGQTWQPIPIEGLPGAMGVLICLDFLHREGEAHRKLVDLAQSHFLAVPSYTPFHTIPEFHAKAQEEAQRYGRPVLWADVSVFSGKKGAGGSSIFVDEGHAGDLRRFPDHAGYLEPGDEGVIVADVDLGFERVGPSTRYDQTRPIVPFAAAGLVYTAQPAGERYAEWLAKTAPLLEREDDEAVELLAARIAEARTLLQDAGTSNKAREARVRRLLRELDSLVKVEQLRRYTREIVLPVQALPLPALRAVLARGAADALFEWQKDWRGFGLGPLVQRLHEAAKPVAPPDPSEWSEAGGTALESVRQTVRQEPTSPTTAQPSPEVAVRWAIPSGLDPAALGELRRGGYVFRFRPHPEDFRALDVDWEQSGRQTGPEVSLKMKGEVSQGTLSAAQELFLLTVAEAPGPTGAMAVAVEGELVGAILPITHAGEHWALQVWEADWDALTDGHRQTLRAIVRGEPVDSGACEPLVEAGLVGEESATGRRWLADPVLAARLSPVRIHHLSDIHFGHKSAESIDKKEQGLIAEAVDPGNVREGYLSHLEGLRKAGKGPHALIISGDLTEWATRKQCEEARQWVDRIPPLLEPHVLLDDDAQRILLVGGNHDVDRSKMDSGDERARHENFAEFFKHYPHPHLEKAPAERALAAIAWQDLGITVLLLGTSELGSEVEKDREQYKLLQELEKLPNTADPREREKAQKLATEAARIDPGLVNAKDLHRVSTHGWNEKLPVRIAVLHHPPAQLPPTEVTRYPGLLNAGAVKQVLMEQRFCLALCGHMHAGWFIEERWIKNFKASTLRIAAAPSLGSREIPENNGFNLIEVFRERNAKGDTEYQVRVRRHVLQGQQGWKEHTDEMGPFSPGS